MARFVFAMNVSLDGYVDHDAFAPDPTLFRHWIDHVRNGSGAIYGRRIYDIMRYWDADHPEWSADERDFAAAWRAQPKWVVSRTLTSVGPNATLLSADIETAIRRIKAERDGWIDISGTVLAHSATGWSLIDEYRMYFLPFVLGRGKPFFAGPRPPLRLTGHERIGDQAVRLSYAPA